MNEHQNRARVRSRAELYPVRPETALVGWSAAAQVGLADHSGPQTDHLAALVRRARRREARRRFLRLWLPRRTAAMPGVPSQDSLREAVQTGLAVALPQESAYREERQHDERAAVLVSSASRAAAMREHPAGRRIPDQKNRETAAAYDG